MNETLALARPLMLLGLLLMPIYALYRFRLLRRSALPHAPLQYQRAGRTGSERWLIGGEILLLTLLLIALAGPYRHTELELIDDPGIDIMLVLDVSLSMLAEDFPPNRLEVLHRTVRDFLHRGGQHRVGMVIFAKDVFIQSPLTDDRRILLELLDSANVYTMSSSKSGGTAIGDALLVATEHLSKVRLPGRDQAVILITDGESNSGIDPVLAARHLRQEGQRFYAIGIGGEKPVEVFFEGRRIGTDGTYLAFLDDAQLKNVAAAADGRYYRATDDRVLEDIFLQLSRLESAPLEVRQVSLEDVLVRDLVLITLALFTVWLVLGGVVLRRPLK